MVSCKVAICLLRKNEVDVLVKLVIIISYFLMLAEIICEGSRVAKQC